MNAWSAARAGHPAPLDLLLPDGPGFLEFCRGRHFSVFLINMPVISYFEVGTVLTPNHGHTAFMAVFGMEAVALRVMALRQVLNDTQWEKVEGYIRISFWGLNGGFILMVVGNVFPAGVMQFYDVLNNGYWHGRGLDYLNQDLVRTVELARLPGDLVFTTCGVVPQLPPRSAPISAYMSRRPRNADCLHMDDIGNRISL